MSLSDHATHTFHAAITKRLLHAALGEQIAELVDPLAVIVAHLQSRFKHDNAQNSCAVAACRFAVVLGTHRMGTARAVAKGWVQCCASLARHMVQIVRKKGKGGHLSFCLGAEVLGDLLEAITQQSDQSRNADHCAVRTLRHDRGRARC